MWLPFFFYERFLISQNLARNSNNGRGVWSNKIRDTLELRMESQLFFFLYTVVWMIHLTYISSGWSNKFYYSSFFFSFSLFLSFVLSAQYCINSYCCCCDLCPNRHRDKPSMLITLYTVYPHNSDHLYFFPSFFHVYMLVFFLYAFMHRFFSLQPPASTFQSLTIKSSISSTIPISFFSIYVRLSSPISLLPILSPFLC